MKTTTKRLFLAAFMIVIGLGLHSINSSAQTILPQGALSYKAWGNISNSDGVKLTEDDLRDILDSKLYTNYSEARGKFVSGRTLCIIGIPTAAYGLFLACFPEVTAKLFTKNASDGTYTGAVIGSVIAGCMVCIAGDVLLGIGIPKFFVGRHQIKNVVNEYNQQHGYSYVPSMSFGAQQYGVGFAFNF